MQGYPPPVVANITITNLLATRMVGSPMEVQPCMQPSERTHFLCRRVRMGRAVLSSTLLPQGWREGHCLSFALPPPICPKADAVFACGAAAEHCTPAAFSGKVK